MDKSTIIARLREYEAELKAAGVEHLVLHGSYARGTAIREGSDVDVIADFDPNRKQSLIGRVHLGNRLTDILGVKAGLCDRNLCDRKMLRPEVLSGARVGSCLLVRPRNAGSATSWTRIAMIEHSRPAWISRCSARIQ